MADKMTRCPEGHFFDPSEHAACPSCALPRDSGAAVRVGIRGDPVVGWLVCLEGPDKGKDYRLRAEKNFVGRAPHMDVVIESDATVSREKHGVVVFDPKKKSFWLLPGEASGLVYLNGEMVNAPSPMKAGDVVELGQTKLVLIPFCGDKYSWSES